MRVDSMRAKIAEIFKSIQGEGLYQGVPQVFVRFFGCNLKCSFCDTKLEYYQEKTLQEVTDEILSYKDYHSVSLTGGEPLLQIKFLGELVRFLKKEGKKIYLETNGILYENLGRIIEYLDIIAVDFKLPSSTNTGSFWYEHKAFLKIAEKKEVFVKVVIGIDTQAKDIFKAIEIIKAVNGGIQFILQQQNPYESLLEDKAKSFHDICAKSGINTKIMRQLHKELGIK
ncbi:MAG: 7-carboxy-7-deazaguanine synthase QueE [Candidatus Omnitrophota bacterium]|nr:MAG: 7-carboxy-7-deazaguanine synthase QueE [Candidatus Omnitrophota bacterium]